MFDHRPEAKIRKGNTLMAILIITILTVSLFMVGAASAVAPMTITTTPGVNGYTLHPYHYTMDTDQPSYITAASSYPAWITVNKTATNNFNFDGAPPMSVTDYQFHIQVVSQVGGGALWQNWTVHVSYPTWPPHATSIPITTAYVGVLYHYQVVLNETGGFITVYNASGWLSYSPYSLFIEGTPSTAGTDTISIKVRPTGDTNGLIATWQNFTITVTGYSPGFSTSPPTTGSVGAPYTYTPIPTMISSSFYMGATDIPAWLTFDSHTFNGTPLVAGSYNVNLILVNYNSGWPVTIAWQNWTITVGTAIVPHFLNTPSDMYILAMGTVFHYNCSTDIACNVTLLCGPSFLHLNGDNLSGSATLQGHYRIIFMARSITYNTTSYEVFDIKVNPLTWPDVPVGTAWNAMIPIFFLVIVMIISSISPEGISRIVFLGSCSIGVSLLVWTGVFPTWALLISATALVVLLVQGTRNNEVIE